MPSFNFQKQFVPKIEAGIKCTTIRAKRKNPPRPGQVAYLFYGLRTEHTRRLFEHPIVKVQDITINANRTITLDGKLLTIAQTFHLACQDGFNDVAALFDYFDTSSGLPFSGDLITWNNNAERATS